MSRQQNVAQKLTTKTADKSYKSKAKFKRLSK
jgi:hypothetical protein